MEGAIEPSLGHGIGSDDAVMLESLPKEVGVLLIVAGIGGVLLPGPIGTPFLIVGGVVLFPKVFRKLDQKFQGRFPKLHQEGMKQVRRFVVDLERRYPTHHLNPVFGIDPEIILRENSGGSPALRKLNLLLVFIPIAIGLNRYEASPVLIFACSAFALIPLAGLMGDATEALAEYMGATYGGLLNASLGNAPEIIISYFALRQGLVGIVKASITGSIIGNLLLGLGLSMFVGGLKNGLQTFNVAVAKMNSGLLTLSAVGLIIPAVFESTSRGAARAISPHIAGVLFLLYVASIIYTVVTNRPVIGLEAVEAETGQHPEPEPGEKQWGKGKAIGILAAVAVALALMSEILTDAIEPASKMVGLTPIFAGVFLLAAVGNAAEILNALRFARKGQMDLAIGVTVGASIQVALVVAPVLVFAGALMKTKETMDLLFSGFEVAAIALAVYITRNLTIDGESNWLEGLMLLAVYLMLGFGFFFLPHGVLRP